MYGIVNKAIQGLIVENFGEEAWQKIKDKSGVHVVAFLSNNSYPDEMTYKLAAAASETLNLSMKDVLIAFGEYWVLNTVTKGYGSLMKSGGSSLREFLVNLPDFHSRVMLTFPNLTPPEFRVSNIKDRSLNLQYYSKREGLMYFVFGLIQGLGKSYDTDTKVTILKQKNGTYDHDEFLVEW
jgi:hypothetical protein